NRPGRVSTRSLKNRECWREHGMRDYGSIQKLARDGRVVEDMLNAIHACPHFVQPFGLRALVSHHQLVPLVDRQHQGMELLRRESRQKVVIDDLQIIRAFRKAGIHKRLHVITCTQCRELWPGHLRGMATRNCCSGACGPKIRRVRMLAPFYLFLQRYKGSWITPHV